MIPLPLISALIAGAISGAGVWTYQANKYDAQIATIQRDQTIAAHKQLEIAHAQTIALQTKADTAARKHASRSTALANAVRAAGVERDRLRDELSKASVQLPDASCTSVRQHAATLSDVFGECAAEIERVAGPASGHAADSLMLQEAWPVQSER
jgi:hypothetical protein